MIRIGAGGGISRRTVRGGEQSIRTSKETPVIACRALALIVNRRVKNLLAEAGEFHIGQTFDLVEEIIDARRGFDVETPVVPILVDLDKRVGLRIIAIVALEKVVQQERVALVIHERLDVQICSRGRLVAEVK